MASLMVASTRCWRGVSPVASGGPSGSSLTLRALFVMVRTVRPEPACDQTPVRTGVSPRCSGRSPADRPTVSVGIAEPDRVHDGVQLGACVSRRVRRPELLEVDREPVDVDDPDVRDPPNSGVRNEAVAGALEDVGVGPTLFDGPGDTHPHPGRRVSEPLHLLRALEDLEAEGAPERLDEGLRR